MNTKIAKKLIHFWILLGSILTLGIGWVALAHSPKPDMLPMFSTSTNVTVSMSEIPSLDSLVNGSVKPGLAKVTMNVAPTRFRTAGS